MNIISIQEGSLVKNLLLNLISSSRKLLLEKHYQMYTIKAELFIKSI